MSKTEQSPEHMVENKGDFLAPLTPDSSSNLPYEEIISAFDELEKMDDESSVEEQYGAASTQPEFYKSPNFNGLFSIIARWISKIGPRDLRQ